MLILLFILDFGLGHDLLLDVARHDIVMAELHVIAALTAGHARQRPSVGHDLAQWDLGIDGLHPAARVHVLENSNHVLLYDHDRDEAITEAVEFLTGD